MSKQLSDLTVDSVITAFYSKATGAMGIMGASGGSSNFEWQVGGKLRWIIGRNQDPESINNLGSNLVIGRYNDAGTTYLGDAIKVDRASGNVTLGTNLTVGNQITAYYGAVTGNWTTGNLYVNGSGAFMDYAAGGKVESLSTTYRGRLWAEEANAKVFVSAQVRSNAAPAAMELQASSFLFQYGALSAPYGMTVAAPITINVNQSGIKFPYGDTMIYSESATGMLFTNQAVNAYKDIGVLDVITNGGGNTTTFGWIWGGSYFGAQCKANASSGGGGALLLGAPSSTNLYLIAESGGVIYLRPSNNSAVQTTFGTDGSIGAAGTINTTSGNSIGLNINNYGIGYPGYTFQTGGNRIAMKWASNTIYGGVDNSNSIVLGTTSARKWKAAITNATSVLARVEKLRSVEYTIVDIDGETKNGQRHHGLIADEVRRIFPGAIGETGNDPEGSSVNYMEIVPILVKAIQELSEEIKLLKKGLA